MDNITTRKKWAEAITKHEASTSEVETEKRSVMQSFSKSGRLFASAEYVKVEGEPAQVTYRVFK